MRGTSCTCTWASSAKNQSRWQFGVVMCSVAAADPSEEQLHPGRVRRAHRPARRPGHPAGLLQVQRTTEGSGPDQAWDEAVECEIEVTAEGAALPSDGVVEEFAIAGGEDAEPLGEPGSLNGTELGTWSAAGSRWRAWCRRAGRSASRPWWWSGSRLRVGVLDPRSAVPQRWEDALLLALIAATPSSALPAGSIHLDDLICSSGPAARGRAPERGRLAGAGRPGGGRRHASPADHPVRPSGTRRGEPGRLRRHRDRRDLRCVPSRSPTLEKAEVWAHRPGGRRALLERVESMDAETMVRLYGTILLRRPERLQPAAHHRPARQHRPAGHR